MLPWTTPHKLLFRVVLLCVILTVASIILTTLIMSFSTSYNQDDNTSFTPCLNQTTILKYMVSAYRKASKTLSTRLNKKHFTHQTLSKPYLTIAKHLSISSSIVKLKHVNCLEIINGSQDYLPNITFPVGIPICDSMYTHLTSDCAMFKKYRGYITSPLTEEEASFPLAFSIISHKDAEMVERLLRAIYRPQNYYCIHVDGKSRAEFFRAISDIANCFTNVVIASQRIDVTWGTFSVLAPEILCMEELWRFPSWKYFLTLTGQEFPLKTNHELVKILKALKGANDVLTTVAQASTSRWRNTVPAPGILLVKGSVHITVNRSAQICRVLDSVEKNVKHRIINLSLRYIVRDFVDYILHNETAKTIMEWTKQTEIPDETFFAVLGANPQLGIRGTYKGGPEMSERRPFLSRYKNWGDLPCAGRFVHEICILTAGDLPLLFTSKKLFANKFFIHESRVALGCLEEKIFNDTLDEYLGTKSFDTSYYEGLDLVHNQVT